MYDVMDMHYIITKDKSMMNLGRYLHTTAFSKHYHLHQRFKNENFITWPGIDNLNFATLLGTTNATELGHLDKERLNFQSTQ